MDYAEKKIYSEVIDRLKNNNTWFTDAGHVAPAHFDWDRNQYSDEGGKKDYPFARPAIFIKFGKINYEQHSPNMKRGKVPLLITVVQDKYVDSGEGSASQAAFEKLLEYKYLVNDLLQYWKGSCFSPLDLIDSETDHTNRNLHVEPLLYETQHNLKRKPGTPA